MPNLNKVSLMGNLTRDPELRVTPKGTVICSFSLAINRKWKDDSGEHEEVVYVDCEAWGKAGENIAKYVTKGRPLYIGGRLKLDQWEDKNTKEKRSKMKVVVEDFQFLGDHRDSGQAPQSDNQGRYSTQSNAAPRTAAPAQNLDEDVPF